MLKNGFYTALGTPLTEDGKVIESALRKHIKQQIEVALEMPVDTGLELHYSRSFFHCTKSS